MNAPLAKFIDWSLIQAMTFPGEVSVVLSRRASRKTNSERWNPRLEEALQFLNRPAFLPTESEPASLNFDADKSGLHFHFPTPEPCAFAANDTVFGRLYRRAGPWQNNPVVILCHGGNGGGYRYFPRLARHCNRAGINVATLEGPYQLQRRPREPGAGTWFGPGYLRLAKTMSQGVAEVRALTGWLLKEGCPAVALWGVSLGGWMAGMAACADARFAAVIPTVPAVRMDHSSFGERIIWRHVRKGYQSQRPVDDALNQTALNLTTMQPVVPKERILLIEAIYDLWVGSEPIEELWNAWGKPEIWRLPLGHISMGISRSWVDEAIGWLAKTTSGARQNSPMPTRGE